MNFNTFILTLHDFFSIWVIQIDENSLKGGGAWPNSLPTLNPRWVAGYLVDVIRG